MRKLLLAAAFGVLIAPSAFAAPIITVGQTSNSNTITATDNGTTTTISGSNILANITQIFGGSAVSGVFFNLAASSIDAAITVGNAIIQHFNGSFCVSSLAGCGGTDFLSGQFTDAAFGANGGPGLVINTNNPPDQLTLKSDVIPASELGAPNALNFIFANLTPVLHLDGSTIGAFTSSIGADASASTVTVPEPGALAVLGIGLLGIGIAKRVRRSA
jgi:hypothetical protein